MAKRKWTLIFYFASDNSLAPSMISQLKAIKDAGFQMDTNVIVYFDPNEFGVPTRIFDVNHKNREVATTSSIGDGEDSFVRNMIEDKVDFNSIPPPIGPVTREFGRQLEKSDEIDVKEALRSFLGYCRENYEAEHYMVFLMGHGMIVASDDFLPDENPKAGISLVDLGALLRDFSDDISNHGALELIGMPSCSMSAIEVAYELQGTAKFMLASQGFSFVGSWPYRQMLKKTLRVIERQQDDVVVVDLLMRLSQLCVHGSTDFMVMGYSADACLCQLTDVDDRLNKPLTDLVVALKAGLSDPRINGLILLAHLKSQSFWQESYTDLFDFCFCLRNSCVDNTDLQVNVKVACEDVMRKLEPPYVYSDHFGTINQYSHGLSVYFPWTLPSEEKGGAKLKTYQQYRFTKELKFNSWFTFLEEYWKKTQRACRSVEDGVVQPGKDDNGIHGIHGLGAFIGKEFGFDEVLEGNKPDPNLGGPKPDPNVGKDECTCPSIKNYPNFPFFSDGVRSVFDPVERKPKGE